MIYIPRAKKNLGSENLFLVSAYKGSDISTSNIDTGIIRFLLSKFQVTMSFKAVYQLLDFIYGIFLF